MSDDMKPYDDVALERARRMLAKHGEFIQLDGIHLGRMLATIDALTADRDAALKVADVATDAAADAVLDAKEVYEVRHLAMIRDLRAAIKECRVYVEDNAAGRFVPSNGAATALLSRLDALLREGA